MEQSKIELRKRLNECREALKTLTCQAKKACQARIKELEAELGITSKLEKASIATDEQE